MFSLLCFGSGRERTELNTCRTKCTPRQHHIATTSNIYQKLWQPQPNFTKVPFTVTHTAIVLCCLVHMFMYLWQYSIDVTIRWTITEKETMRKGPVPLWFMLACNFTLYYTAVISVYLKACLCEWPCLCYAKFLTFKVGGWLCSSHHANCCLMIRSLAVVVSSCHMTDRRQLVTHYCTWSFTRGNPRPRRSPALWFAVVVADWSRSSLFTLHNSFAGFLQQH